MKITEVLTLSEVSKKYNVPLETLRYRLKNLDEGIDYRKTEGNKQPVILIKEGVKKIMQGITSYIVLRGEE